MLGLSNLKKRLQYLGGGSQEARMNKDKLKTLKKALLYSYQAATAKLSDDREFRCLMNPNKLSVDYDEKILSIPFEDICLNSEKIGTTTEGIVPIGVKVGDVFEWKENGTHWIITLKKDEETAYFRGICRKCRFQIEINGQFYWVYIRGPVEKVINWAEQNGNYYNKLNYSLIMYITKDSNTEEFFKRFKVIKIKGQPWEVQATDSISSDGIIEVALKETFTNSIEDSLPKIEITDIDNTEIPFIKGEGRVKPYDNMIYTAENVNEIKGNWYLSNGKATFRSEPTNTSSVEIAIVTGRSGKVTLSFVSDNISLNKDIEILSL